MESAIKLIAGTVGFGAVSAALIVIVLSEYKRSRAAHQAELARLDEENRKFWALRTNQTTDWKD